MLSWLFVDSKTQQCTALHPFRNKVIYPFPIFRHLSFLFEFPKITRRNSTIIWLVLSAPWDKIHSGLKNEVFYRGFPFSHCLGSYLELQLPLNQVYSTLPGLKTFHFPGEDRSTMRAARFCFPAVTVPLGLQTRHIAPAILCLLISNKRPFWCL